MILTGTSPKARQVWRMSVALDILQPCDVWTEVMYVAGTSNRVRLFMACVGTGTSSSLQLSVLVHPSPAALLS